MKAVLFIGDTYIATIEELQQILKANNSKKNKAFGKELLYYFNEGVLSDWLNEHDCPHIANTLPRSEELHKHTDNDILKSIYRSVLNKTECLIDLDSVLSEIASLIRCEVNGKEIPFQNDLVAKIRETDEVSFVFKALENIEEEMTFVLKKIGYYSVEGEGFVMGKDMGEPYLTASSSGHHSKGNEFTVSFGFQAWYPPQRQGKYLLKYIGKKSELLCELVYQPQVLIAEPVFKIKFKEGDIDSAAHVQFGNSDFEFVSEFSHASCLYKMGIEIVGLGSGEERINKLIENINLAVDKGAFRLVSKDELMAIFRWATFWDYDFGIYMDFDYAYRSNDGITIKYCDIELNDVKKPSFNYCFFVFER